VQTEFGNGRRAAVECSRTGGAPSPELRANTRLNRRAQTRKGEIVETKGRGSGRSVVSNSGESETGRDDRSCVDSRQYGFLSQFLTNADISGFDATRLVSRRYRTANCRGNRSRGFLRPAGLLSPNRVS
jgi:hypothetical protein